MRNSFERCARRSAATRSASSCRCSTGATRAWPRPRRSTCRRSHRAARDAPSTRAPKCARPTPAYRSAYDIARHYRDEIVPLRKRIAEENVLRYNGMLIGVFELLADARAQIASVNAPSRRCATSGSPRPTSTWR